MDWSSNPRREEVPLTISCVEEWVRRTGRQPVYTSANGAAASYFCPVRVPSPMRVTQLWVFNGASVSPLGLIEMMLMSGKADQGLEAAKGGNGFVPHTIIARSAPWAQIGADTVQHFLVPETWIGPGLYWVVVGCTDGNAQFQRVFNPMSAGSGEGMLAGFFYGYGPPTVNVGNYGPTYINTIVGFTETAPVCGLIGTL